MSRRRVICLLSLAGICLLHGCADSPAPIQATTKVSHQSITRETVAVATHFESLPTIDLPTAESSIAPSPTAPGRTSDFRRLPPVSPIEASTRPTRSVLVSRQIFERLPRLGHVATTDSRPDAVDLTEKLEPACTAPAISRLPPVVKFVAEIQETPEPVVPRKRFVHTKAPKPPLPPLTRQPAAASGAAGWLMTGSSLMAVSQRADGMIDRGFQLAEKGAYYSAQTEFKQALRTVSQAMDAHFGGSHYSEALAAGWLALEEAGDFSAHSQRGPVVDVGLIVGSHQTPLLKEYALNDASPVLAMQYYFAFAQQQLVEASGQAPVASRALYGLGKIHMVLGEKSSSGERLHGPKAMALQQAALTTDPGNYLSANELGVLLARFGDLHQARTVLQHSVARYALPETWHNLSIVHQRLGEADLAAQSLANWQVALQQTGGTSPQQADNRSMIQWVPPQAFVGQQPGSPDAQSMPQGATQPGPPMQAKQKSGFLWW